MSTLAVPNTIINGGALDATKVQQDIDAIVAFVNTDCITKDGAKTLTGQLTGNGVDPVGANDLARKSYVDAKDTAQTTANTNPGRSGFGTDRAALQSIATSTNTALSFDTIRWDSHSYVPTGTGIVIPAARAGIHIVTFNVLLSGGVSNFLTEFQINGVQALIGVSAANIANTDRMSSGSGMFLLNVADILSVRIWQTTGLNVSFTGRLAAQRLSV